MGEGKDGGKENAQNARRIRVRAYVCGREGEGRRAGCVANLLLSLT